ncbi:MAG: hypothetical protein ACOY0T_05520 [Myxococcota bacterium]
MAIETTQEHFEEEHLLEREQFMKGGRDTAVVVWSLLALMVLTFLIISALAGEPPIPR